MAELPRIFLEAVAGVLNFALTIYMYIVIARAVISWVNPDPRNFIVQFLYRVTEPVLYWVRRKLPIKLGGLDFSPIIVILAIWFAKAFIVKSLYALARNLY
ncbi:MAG: YggT family protein [Deltaproteobacteria bacterium]|nr:YggT family protein [Deltaproteobacteria bacterium]